ncbi:TrmB family transcriptional regulator [Muricomes sp. OA1]|uniref:TrmB family transcriptional regulator n=1 Tax=Clostridia TaxID=186801 RepID=UPI0004B8178E|nr:MULTISPECIES: helix-turn-helix domain-containing protein [Clostridia]MCH1974538.1 TrmB family transcriptional regulator [Muricomes sp. OA1]GKH33318.1 transcriptional regulator [Faecalicatena contorta]
MLQDDRVYLLNKIGFTDSEAKVYLVLLRNGGMTGYEASKYSAVPRSKIYNVLESLVMKGFILYSEEECSNRYAAVPFEEISGRVRDETDKILNKLEELLHDYRAETDLDRFWHIREYDNVIAVCRSILKDTRSELLLQIWAEDLPKILEEIQELEKKGIRLGIVYFGEAQDEVPLDHCCRHGMLEEKKEEMGGRFLTLVSDKKEAVFGQIVSDAVSEVIWTKSKPMVAMAAECVRHDLYCYKGADIYISQRQEELGIDIRSLREIF